MCRDQCELLDDRFSLVSLDDNTGDFVEFVSTAPAAWSSRESLYEEE